VERRRAPRCQLMSLERNDGCTAAAARNILNRGFAADHRYPVWLSVDERCPAIDNAVVEN
jgi:hypothetical protein